MNYYFCGIFSVIISFLIFYYKWYKYGWVGKDKAILYVLASLPFSAIVSLFVKKPIRSYLCIVLGISKEISLSPLWFLLILLFIGAFAEEWVKMLPVLLNKTLLEEKIHIYYSGLLVGLGFGIGEIWYLAYRFSRTQPEYASGIKNFFLLLPGFGTYDIYGYDGLRFQYKSANKIFPFGGIVAFRNKFPSSAISGEKNPSRIG